MNVSGGVCSFAAPSAEVVKRDARATWVYNLIKAPMVSARDYTIRIQSTSSRHPGEPYVSAWTTDNGAGPAAKKGTVRLVQNTGSWELREVNGGAGTAVRYRVLTDPGAALPAWIIDMANQSSVPDILRSFHKRATSGLYEREDAEREAGRAGWRRCGGWRGFNAWTWNSECGVEGGNRMFSTQGLWAALPAMSGDKGKT